MVWYLTMGSDYYLSLKQLFTESLVGNIILFIILFLLTLAQDWVNIFLFIFPIITFSFALFFKIIEVNKWRTHFEDSPIVYNPMGSEKNNANRFNLISLLLLIFLLWMGYESLIHPQLMDTYHFFFIIIYFFLYTFSFFILFFDIWKYSQIKLKYRKENTEFPDETENYEKIVRFLKIKQFRIVSYVNLGIFLGLNGIHIIFLFLTYFGILPGYNIILPGTGLENSSPLTLPLSFFFALIISPTYTIPLLTLIYKDINQLRIEHLEDIIEDFTKNMRILILENFQILNKNLLNDLDMDEFIKTMELRKSFRDYVTQRRVKSVKDKYKTGRDVSERSQAESEHREEEGELEERSEEDRRKEEMKDILKKEEGETQVYKKKEKVKVKFTPKQEEKVKERPKKKKRKKIVSAPKREEREKEKAKEIRQKIRKESTKKAEKPSESEEFHDKNREHREWMRKQAVGSILTINKKEGRRKCPNCEEDRKQIIHESIDKNNIIMSSPRIYGKKYKCGRCGTEWREV